MTHRYVEIRFNLTNGLRKGGSVFCASTLVRSTVLKPLHVYESYLKSKRTSTNVEMILSNATHLINATVQTSVDGLAKNTEDTGGSYHTLASFMIILALFLPMFMILLVKCCQKCCNDGLYFGYLKVYTLPKKVFFDESTDCQICILCAVEYTNGESLTCLPCNHLFHGSCLRNYGRKYRSERCPICLELIYPDQPPTESNNRFALLHTAKDPLICDDGTPKPSYGTTLVY